MKVRKIAPSEIVSTKPGGTVENLSPTPAVPSSVPSQLTLDEAESNLFRLTNAERKRAAGLGAVSLDVQLQLIARSHANWMSANHVLQHQPMDLIKDRGFGENVAFGQPNPEEVVLEEHPASWMNSPSHRRNILQANWVAMGASVAKDSEGNKYWVQVFSDKVVHTNP